MQCYVFPIVVFVLGCMPGQDRSPQMPFVTAIVLLFKPTCKSKHQSLVSSLWNLGVITRRSIAHGQAVVCSCLPVLVGTTIVFGALYYQGFAKGKDKDKQHREQAGKCSVHSRHGPVPSLQQLKDELSMLRCFPGLSFQHMAGKPAMVEWLYATPPSSKGRSFEILGGAPCGHVCNQSLKPREGCIKEGGSEKQWAGNSSSRQWQTPGNGPAADQQSEGVQRINAGWEVTWGGGRHAKLILPRQYLAGHSTSVD
eukprot:883818-Pelagomonas_calceolata.AAC.6